MKMQDVKSCFPVTIEFRAASFRDLLDAANFVSNQMAGVRPKRCWVSPAKLALKPHRGRTRKYSLRKLFP